MVFVHQPGFLCGLDAAAAVFETIDRNLHFESLAWDGAPITDLPAGVAQISGSAASLLAGQRVAVALIARLSGIASHTHRYVHAVRHTRARIIDLSTTAGTLEGYAIECGGGRTRIAGLAETVLLTTAHVQLAGGICAAVERARRQLPAELPVAVEVSALDEAKQAFEAQADALLLDGMGLEDIRWIVSHAPPDIWVHATGNNITPSTIGSLALTGVHAITPQDLVGTAPRLETSLAWTDTRSPTTRGRARAVGPRDTPSL
jgi:nicotinate-nucleotide pyrophosphorylase (carboxylating)